MPVPPSYPHLAEVVDPGEGRIVLEYREFRKVLFSLTMSAPPWHRTGLQPATWDFMPRARRHVGGYADVIRIAAERTVLLEDSRYRLFLDELARGERSTWSGSRPLPVVEVHRIQASGVLTGYSVPAEMAFGDGDGEDDETIDPADALEVGNLQGPPRRLFPEGEASAAGLGFPPLRRGGVEVYPTRLGGRWLDGRDHTIRIGDGTRHNDWESLLTAHRNKPGAYAFDVRWPGTREQEAAHANGFYDHRLVEGSVVEGVVVDVIAAGAVTAKLTVFTDLGREPVPPLVRVFRTDVEWVPDLGETLEPYRKRYGAKSLGRGWRYPSQARK